MTKIRLYTEDVVKLTSIVLNALLEFVEEQCRPDEVFSHGELNEWAEENGYVKESE